MNSIKDFFADILDQAQTQVAEQIVNQETQGLTEAERLRRVEVLLTKQGSDLEALGIITNKQVKQVQKDMSAQEDGLMSVIFQLFGHLTGRTITPELISKIKDRANEIWEERPDEKTGPAFAGQIIEQATREILGG